jgi:hypothetical protein
MTHNDLSAQEIVDALHSHLAVLDRDGNITHVNEAWVRFSEERGALPSSTGVGVNYFAVCRARGATPEVEEMLAGIRDVINEAIPQFRAEYTCNTPKEADKNGSPGVIRTPDQRFRKYGLSTPFEMDQ